MNSKEIAEASDALLDVTLRLFRHQPRSATREALRSMRDTLVEEFGLTLERAERETDAAIYRRAARCHRPELRAIAATEDV